jgi:hypothetical protein
MPTVRQSLDEERSLQVKVYLMESDFPRKFCTNAHM